VLGLELKIFVTYFPRQLRTEKILQTSAFLFRFLQNCLQNVAKLAFFSLLEIMFPDPKEVASTFVPWFKRREI